MGWALADQPAREVRVNIKVITTQILKFAAIPLILGIHLTAIDKNTFRADFKTVSGIRGNILLSPDTVDIRQMLILCYCAIKQACQQQAQRYCAGNGYCHGKTDQSVSKQGGLLLCGHNSL